MGIFYSPPPPAGRTAFTPPEPHVPIGTQGQQPPRRTIALMMVAVLAAWPATGEPRLTRPNDQRVKIAPLTLTYGSQPIPQGPLSVTELTKIYRAWPPDLEPRLGPPNAQRVRIAPLTLTYGAQRLNPPLSVVELTKIVASWAQTWDAQRAPKSLAWNVPVVSSVPYTAPPALLWAAWTDPPRPPPRPITIAPLTLPYGSQPVPQAPLAPLKLTTIVGTWAQTWGAQAAAKNAGWNVAAVVSPYVAYTPRPALLWTAWIAPWRTPPRLVQNTPPSGVAPVTVAGEILAVGLQIRQALAAGLSITQTPTASVQLRQAWPAPLTVTRTAASPVMVARTVTWRLGR